MMDWCLHSHSYKQSLITEHCHATLRPDVVILESLRLLNPLVDHLLLTSAVSRSNIYDVVKYIKVNRVVVLCSS